MNIVKTSVILVIGALFVMLMLGLTACAQYGGSNKTVDSSVATPDGGTADTCPTPEVVTCPDQEECPTCQECQECPPPSVCPDDGSAWVTICYVTRYSANTIQVCSSATEWYLSHDSYLGACETCVQNQPE